MKGRSIIVTVGICPSWDVVCIGKNIDWSGHTIVSQTRTPAGKALNVSRALAWMNKQNTAAGLWGLTDFDEMSTALKPLCDLVDVRFTKAPGRTRDNITVLDSSKNRDMHLRSESKLASVESLADLEKDLLSMINPDSLCVFAGSMPSGKLLDRAISFVESVKNKGAKIVVDTSRAALEKIVGLSGIEILKPNLDELSELLGVKVPDDSAAIARAVRPLLDKAKTIVVTRGEKGAVVVTKNTVLKGRCVTKNKIITTVGCGDYFLAGFLCGESLEDSLEKALKAAALRAWGWSDDRNWSEVENKIEVELL